MLFTVPIYKKKTRNMTGSMHAKILVTMLVQLTSLLILCLALNKDIFD